MDEDEDTTSYDVVMNHEEQYSIWPADKDIPAGWREAGCSGTRTDYLAFVERVWTDMRPLSLREHMRSATLTSKPEFAGQNRADRARRVRG